MFFSMRATAFDSDAPLGDCRAIIRRDPADGKPEMVELAWGLAPSEPAGRPFRFFRAEGRSFPTNRCLVPASEFHMKRGERRYRVRLDDGNWFYLAGLWRAAAAGWPEAFAILTVAANAEIARYQDRQGAIILRNRHMQWLDHALPEDQLLRTLPPRSFLIEEIGAAPFLQPSLPLDPPAANGLSAPQPVSIRARQ